MSKKKNLPLLTGITITGIAAEGKAITRINDCVVFVPYCVPGDIVDLQITKKKHNFMEGRVERFVHYSDERCEPRCPHYGSCGGCKWQILPYAAQLKYKQQQIEDNLTRIGKVQLPEIRPIIGSPEPYEYRNKLEFTCSNKRWVSWEEVEKAGGMDQVDKGNGIGFHIPNCFDKVLHIERCYLMDNTQNEIRQFVFQYAQEKGLTFFDLKSQTGFLRTLIVRNNHLGQYMLTVVMGEDRPKEREQLLEALHQRFENIIALLYVINDKCNDTITDLPVFTYFGQNYIEETMEDLVFKVGPKSFYQTNTQGAYRLYQVVRELAQLSGQELVFDLYTGTGTIANFVAHQARKVIGIEYVKEAIEDAKVNAERNGLNNTLFLAGDMKDILTPAFLEQYGRPEVIITDPPRAGMHEDVIHTLLLARPERIVYVSCNPATQARDLNLLDEAYQVAAVQPVDMFPHTQHVENVVLLTKRG